MLDTAVKFLGAEVNVYLKRRTASELVKVVTGPVVDDSGKWAVSEGSIGLSVINIEEERVVRSQAPDRVLLNGSLVTVQPGLKLNLQLLFASRHSNYEHALRYLSYVLMFFQAHPSFTSEEYPALDPALQKLSLELINYGPEQLNQIWTYLGAKYLPSVVYRMRMVVLQDAEPTEVGPPITEVDTEIHSL
jgi:hypothetical protein